MTKSIELDFGYNMTFAELADQIEPHNLQANIVDLVGPGGGNPVIKLSGTYIDILDYLAEYTNNVDEEMQYHVEQIK